MKSSFLYVPAHIFAIIPVDKLQAIGLWDPQSSALSVQNGGDSFAFSWSDNGIGFEDVLNRVELVAFVCSWDFCEALFCLLRFISPRIIWFCFGLMQSFLWLRYEMEVIYFLFFLFSFKRLTNELIK